MNAFARVAALPVCLQNGNLYGKNGRWRRGFRVKVNQKEKEE
jgi:hypothetical protein